MPWELCFLFFLIAFVYASVGFGGGSSYLAVLALYGMPMNEMRLMALVCNIIVVTGGVWLFWKHRHIDWRKTIPIVMCSVPLAFLGARLKISEHFFFVLLGCSLILAAVLLWVQAPERRTAEPDLPPKPVQNGLLGGVIGLLSGMVGIGGGIFLSPLLNLMRWDSARRIAAAASVFILANSLAGIAGQLVHLPGGLTFSKVGLLGLAVLLGGQAGARISISRFNLGRIRQLTGLLVFAAGVEVLLKHLGSFF